MKLAASCLVVASLAALALAGCGGSGSSTGSSGTTPDRRPDESDLPAKKATAPRAPAGARVVACAIDGEVGVADADGRARISGLRAAGTDCGAARAAMGRWLRTSACRLGRGESRTSCSLGAYRCQAIAVGRGTAVSCARGDGSDVSFVARRRP